MKFDIIKGIAIKNHLIKTIDRECEFKENRKRDFHIFLHKLLNIFEYGNFLLTQKKKASES